MLLLALAFPMSAAAQTAPDTASGVLVERDYFLPYDLEGGGDSLSSVRVPAASAGLERVLAQAQDRRRPFKVAVIGSEVDLGAVPDLIDRPPQRYAELLYKELAPVAARTEASVLVAMPRGVAVAGPQATAAARAAVKDVRVADGASPAALTTAAAEGIRAVSEANGHPLPGDEEGDDGGDWWLRALGGATVLLLIGIAFAMRRRADSGSA